MGRSVQVHIVNVKEDFLFWAWFSACLLISGFGAASHTSLLLSSLRVGCHTELCHHSIMESKQVSEGQKRHSAWVDMAAGGIGGALAKSLLSPVQRVVVLKQLGEHNHLSSVGIIKMIRDKEGYKGFFRGNLTSMIIRFPYSGIQFLLYSKIKFFFQDLVGVDSKDGSSAAFQKFVMKCGAGGLSASLAGAMVYPGEVVRLRLMSGEEQFRTIGTTTKLIWQETNSPRNFYRGLNASLAQRVPDILINFAVYETVKDYLVENNYLGDTSATMVGASAGAIASISMCFPLDIAKRRIGMSGKGKSGKTYNGIAHCLGTIYREEGIAGCYRGAFLESVRCVPQVVLMWLCIVETQKLLSSVVSH